MFVEQCALLLSHCVTSFQDSYDLLVRFCGPEKLCLMRKSTMPTVIFYLSIYLAQSL